MNTLLRNVCTLRLPYHIGLTNEQSNTINRTTSVSCGVHLLDINDPEFVTHLVGAVEKGEDITLLHRHLTRTLLCVVIQGNDTLLANVIHHRCFLLLGNRNKKLE